MKASFSRCESSLLLRISIMPSLDSKFLNCWGVIIFLSLITVFHYPAWSLEPKRYCSLARTLWFGRGQNRVSRCCFKRKLQSHPVSFQNTKMVWDRVLPKQWTIRRRGMNDNDIQSVHFTRMAEREKKSYLSSGPASSVKFWTDHSQLDIPQDTSQSQTKWMTRSILITSF